MKVLHVTYYDRYSGSGRAAFRLHRALLGLDGMDSAMLVMRRDTDDPFVVRAPLSVRFKAGVAQRISAALMRFQKDPNPSARSLNLFKSSLPARIAESGADIVHLHWIGGEMLSIRQIPELAKPLVWTLHDAWPFCGSEHCIDPLAPEQRFRNSYSKASRRKDASGVDLDRKTFLRKEKYFRRKMDCSFVAPSRFLADAFRENSLFRGCECAVIENPLDTAVFRPLPKDIARKEWNLPPEGKILLAGAQSLDAPVKGMALLREALSLLAGSANAGRIYLVVFGSGAGKLLLESGFSGRNAGIITDEKRMAALYAAADVFVLPSRMENLPCTAAEALCCGTPVAAFRTGGVPELVEHGKSGFLAEAFRPDDLVRGIIYCLEHGKELKTPEGFRDRFSMDSAARRYREIYRKRLEQRI